MNKNQNEFKVIFDGEVELVSTDILISNLLSTTHILQELNKELKGPKIDISIRPFALGSFEIVYAVVHASIVSGLLSVLTKSHLEYLKSLISIALDIFKIKKHLGGEKPAECIQEGNKVRIKNNFGTILIADGRALDYYKNNTSINEFLNRAFRSIEHQENIESMKVTDKENKELFNVERKDFKNMYAPNKLLEEGEKYKIIDDAKLVIFKIVWEPGYKWGFIYEGIRINAYIKDEDSFNKIKTNGFYEGDYFIAKLKITQRYDERVKTFINTDYEIEEIKDHIKAPKQKVLNFSVENEGAE